MKNILALLVFSVACVCMGQVAVFRAVRNLTARPFTASELRLLFTGYGKQNATVEEPGLCPDNWLFPEKPNPHSTALIMWNATFDVASPGKITFKLSEPDVCSALFVDGMAVAAWKEAFPPVMLEEGTHAIQMLAAQRKGERLPKILAYREGHATKLKYSLLKLDRKARAFQFVQTGACLALSNGKVIGVDAKRIVPAKRVDTRARIANMQAVAGQGEAVEVPLSLEYPEIAAPLLAAVDVHVNYVAASGRILGKENITVSGHAPTLELRPVAGAEIAKLSFQVEGRPVFPECNLHIVDALGKSVLRASGKSLFIGEERALLVTDTKSKIQLPAAKGNDVIMDMLGNKECLAFAQKAFPEAKVLAFLPKTGTLPELCALENLPENAGRLVLLGSFSPDMLAFICRRCATSGIVPVAVALPGDRLAALKVKETGLRLGMDVLDLWSDMMN